ncbi:metalloregulator ArsR/SmtB family transcription factor [Bifidobacterium cuniculi]|uniref:Arsenate reductase n=1 Tax=Bifidobacterium cuniculi TaxID=1688 RepID=A0A087B4K9_9BIFI|nr:metalloregulator ArsR/SmtB family transcription factor [Bifidobacterium cuniculi]KFI65959.1 arsenate reductase [Bifidobacterium cuniculi]
MSPENKNRKMDDWIVARASQYKALGDSTRLRLVLMVRDAAPSPVCTCDLPEIFGMGQSTLSHHLGKLVDAGILDREQRGRWAYFTLDEQFDASMLGHSGFIHPADASRGDCCSSRKDADGTVTVLFACRRNSGRSQIAAAIAQSMAPSGMRVLSAGSEPAHEVDPLVVQALGEIGLKPLSSPSKLDPTVVKNADWVVTMGCGESCPYFPGTHREDWAVPDPHTRDIDEVRDIVARMQGKVADLMARIEKNQENREGQNGQEE